MTSINLVKRKTHLLSNQPSDTDAFDAGHGRVAKALAGLIADEKGGKAIALSGPFGSGKSTVVRLLEQDLRNSKKDTRIFVYDAWEHQGDPLRRSFIESLIKFLRNNDWALEKEWNDEQERLARRKETTTVETKPKLTTWGRWVAVSLFFSPLGIVAANSFITNKDGNLQLSSPEVFIWIIGIIVTILPILIVTFAWLFGKKDPFYLLVKESEQEEETKTIQTPDPTTIEFQIIFRKIIGGTLSDPDRQLIVVVDNLDRLPPEQALQTWATMRTFFANGTSGKPWEDRFWLLVPINFNALNGMFGESDDNQVSKPDAAKTSTDTQEESSADFQNGVSHVDPAQEAVQAFADKTFHTVFHVAPPVLSDWEAFMKEQLREAFPETTVDGDIRTPNYHAVYRVYRTQAVRGNQIPTPRDIKVFINRLSALYRQWGDEMSLRTLAAFELMRRYISPNGHEITEGNLLSERLKTELGLEDWRKQFASLHFNVDPDRSIQVLIGEEVQTALETGGDGTRRLSDLQNLEGFDAVLEDVVRKIQDEGTAREVANSAFALSDVSISTPAVQRSVWDLLRKRILAESDWQPASLEEGKGLVQILEHTPAPKKEELSAHLLTSIPKATFSSDSAKRRKETNQWVTGVLPLVRHILRVNNEVVDTGMLRDTFHTPRGLDVYIDIMRALSSEDNTEQLAEYFRPHPDDSTADLDEKMVEVITADLLDKQVLEGLRLMKRVDRLSNVAWTATANILGNKLQWNQSLDEEALQTHLEGVLVLGAVLRESHVRKRFGDNASGRASLSHHLHEERENVKIAALCVLLRVMYSSNQNKGNNQGSAQTGHTLFNQVLQNPSAPSQKPITEAVVQTITRLDIAYEVIQSSNRHNNTTKFLKAIVKELAEREDSAEHLSANFICAFPELIHDNLTLENSLRVFRDADEDGAVLQLLRKLKQEEWFDYLKRETDHLYVLTALSSKDGFVLGSEFSDALLDHAEWMLETGTSPAFSPREWRKVLAALADDEREALLGKIQRRLLEHCRESVEPVLTLYYDLLSESSTAKQETINDPDAAVSDRFSNLIDRGNTLELQWLADVISNRPKLEHNTGDAYWNTFRRRVQEKGAGSSGPVRDAYSELAEALGISIPKPDDDETGEESA